MSTINVPIRPLHVISENQVQWSQLALLLTEFPEISTFERFVQAEDATTSQISDFSYGDFRRIPFMTRLPRTSKMGDSLLASSGHDKMQLFNLPISESNISQATAEINLPAPITRRALTEHPSMYYDKNGGRSISITVDGIDKDVNDIVICNLEQWDRRPSQNKVAIDPVLGRLLFPMGVEPKKVLVAIVMALVEILEAGRT